MNKSKAQSLFRNAWRLTALLTALLAVSGVRAADEQQSGRFLLIFETSPVLKKNLPIIRQQLGQMFAANLQNEIRSGDDLAVWTVDQELHTGTYPLASWSPDDAETYTERLNDFLGQQKFTRHASLAAVQPLLNRVTKNSDRLTVLIFCDSQSRLIGTPYDIGVNDIITNAAARLNGAQSTFIVVLRVYQGEYLGSSVNRSVPLNFPKFPTPPAPTPPPVVSTVIVPVPLPAPVSRPVVTPVPALIIVGTNVGTNVSALIKPAATPPAPAPAFTPNPPGTNTVATASPATPPVAATPPANPAPAVAPPAPVQPAPAPVPTKTSPPEPATVSAPTTVAPASQPVEPSSNAVTTTAETSPPSSTDAGYLWPLVIGGGALGVAVILVIWLVARARQPRGSLITSSMQDDPRLPPRK